MRTFWNKPAVEFPAIATGEILGVSAELLRPANESNAAIMGLPARFAGAPMPGPVGRVPMPAVRSRESIRDAAVFVPGAI